MYWLKTSNIENAFTEREILAMTRQRSKKDIQRVLHEGCLKFEPETLSELVEMGANPLCRDQNGKSCIDKALENKKGN